MPAVRHKKTDNKFFFVHIPRTAGRFLVENFFHHGCEIIHPFIDEPIPGASPDISQEIEGIQMLHAHEAIYNKWNKVKNIPHFTIVRNPIDKFFSASSRPDLDLSQSYIENWDNFNKEISKKHFRNWFRPQHEFISSKTKVWKYEDGFRQDFCDWISDIVSFPFNIKPIVYCKVHVKDKFKKTEVLVNNVKKFYRKDFKDFDYT